MPRSALPIRLIAVGTVAFASLFAAGSASAAHCTGPACVPLQFNWAVLDTPGTPDQVVVSPSGSPIVAIASVSPTSLTTATFTVDPSDFSFPTYNFTKPVPGTIDVTLKNPATGNLDASSGAMNMTADMIATINLTGIGSCTVDTGAQKLDTAATQPLLGVPFSTDSLISNFATAPGALGVSWTTLPAGSGPACPIVSAFLSGAGGLWLSRDIAPPQLAIKFAHIKTVTAGHTAVVKATISNTGGDATGTLQACLAAPKPLKPATNCHTISSISGGASASVSFKVKTAKNKHGSYKLTLTTTGNSAPTAKKSATLKVRAAKVHHHHHHRRHSPGFTG